MKKNIKLIFSDRFLFWSIFVVLSVIYFTLAYKNPFKQNNLVSNLEPFPDTFYYSVPVWNWIHGDGYKMAYEGMEIIKGVPPLYGFFLVPFFKVFGDVRSYYFANMLLAFVSIFLFIRLVMKIFDNSKIKWWICGLTGLILVTNFYFYNLPTLMMAENLQILLILATVSVMLEKFNIKNIILSIVLGLTLWFSKLSNFPVIFCLVFWLLVRIISTKFWKKYDKRVVYFILLILASIVTYFAFKIVIPNFSLLTEGDWFFSFEFFKKFFPVYLSEFIGKNGHYLWYFNQQIENIAGYLALFGIVIGLIKKEYRQKTLILLSVILAVVVFHSFLYFPEGRYISVVIPLYIIFIGFIPELFQKIRLGKPVVIIISLLYLGIRQNINNFPDRKITSIKRQIMDNQRVENEIPWNYLAIENYNKFFNKKDKNAYLGTLLPPFNFMFFGNGNYNYLPLSPQQEFGESRGLLTQIYKDKGSLLDYYEYLLKTGNTVFVTNYWFGNNLIWPLEFGKIENRFVLKEVADDCTGGICKIYKVELMKK